MPVVEVSYEVDFEAAHWLPNVPEEHKCRRMHGHSYRVVITVKGLVTNGMVVDYADIKAAADPLVELLDHHIVNDHVPNSTSENLAVWFWEGLHGSLPELFSVRVHETPRAYSTYFGEG